MSDLSPAAQAVIDAVVAASPRLQERGIRNTRSPLIAAALRAAVEQVLPLNSPDRLPPAGNSEAGHYVHGWAHCQLNARTDLLAIAAELERVGNGH